LDINVKAGETGKCRSGAWVGGIGCGGFELRPDGRFHDCQIFNDWRTSEMLNAQFIHMDKDGMRLLGHDEYLCTYGVMRGAKEIRYRGEYPKVELSFPEANTTITWNSFFIPGDLKHSTMPAVHARIRGKGRLLLLLGGRYRGIPRFRDNSVILESPEGGLGIRSAKGRVIAFPKGDKILAVHFAKPGQKFRTPSPEAFKSPDEHHIGVLWDGEYDDEIILAWHYPDSRDNLNQRMGQYYENNFRDCRSVLDYAFSRRGELLRKSAKFHKSIFSAKAPRFLKEAYSAQLSAFARQSWLAKDGRFGVWEGSGCCCGLGTTDVAHYGSWLYASMFPDLEKEAIRLTAKFQRKDGWIAHALSGAFTRVDGYHRKDMNMQFVLSAWRDYFLWKDRAFLREMYPKIKKAITGALAWDKDGDGVPEVRGREQTFDAWDMQGCSIYVGCLWLGSLRAAAAAARVMGDRKFADDCEWMAGAARDTLIAKLWNGKYFILARDGNKTDECCLIDALSGDWYCRLSGLGGILPDAMVKSHLNEVWKRNRKRLDPSYMTTYWTEGEKGWCYVNGTYRDGRRITPQQYEMWTGLEYTFGLHLLLMGMRARGLQAIREVHERKESCGMAWNHVECGGYYFRPMIIGAVWGHT